MRTVIQSTIFILFTGLIVASCGDKNYYGWDDAQSRQIVLSSSVTLAAQPKLQDLQIESGQQLSLFITPNNTPAELLYNNVNIIADGKGGFVSQNMYYPLDGRNIDFFAIHPYVGGASLSTPASFSIVANQADKTNYLDSDLLHATHFDQVRTTEAVGMTFSHKLSKLDFTIVNNEGLDLGALNTVTALSILPSTTIDIADGTITEATGTPVNVTAYGVTGSPEARASVSDIHAIIVPQTIPVNTPLFRISIGQQSYTYTTTEALTFEGGKEYNTQLTITGGEIILTSTINEWGDGGSIGGGLTPD